MGQLYLVLAKCANSFDEAVIGTRVLDQRRVYPMFISFLGSPSHVRELGGVFFLEMAHCSGVVDEIGMCHGIL